MLEQPTQATNHIERRAFIGGSDARIIMGGREPALLRLRRKESNDVGPEDLLGSLIVQPSLVE
jgi:predicted phage-related endonuclease